MTFDALRAQILAFRDERDWDQFHQPKELAMALSIEASELLEHFLWKSTAEVEERIATRREDIADELAEFATLSDSAGGGKSEPHRRSRVDRAYSIRWSRNFAHFKMRNVASSQFQQESESGLAAKAKISLLSANGREDSLGSWR